MGSKGGSTSSSAKTYSYWELAGYDTEADYNAAKQTETDNYTDMFNSLTESLTSQQTTMQEMLDTQTSALDAQTAYYEKQQADDDAEEAEDDANNTRRLALAAKGRPGLLTGGEGDTTAAPVLKKTLGGAA